MGPVVYGLGRIIILGITPPVLTMGGLPGRLTGGHVLIPVTVTLKNILRLLMRKGFVATTIGGLLSIVNYDSTPVRSDPAYFPNGVENYWTSDSYGSYGYIAISVGGGSTATAFTSNRKTDGLYDSAGVKYIRLVRDIK